MVRAGEQNGRVRTITHERGGKNHSFNDETRRRPVPIHCCPTDPGAPFALVRRATCFRVGCEVRTEGSAKGSREVIEFEERLKRGRWTVLGRLG